jgi:hypothetical protein
MFVTHAATLEELRQEVLSDLRRRIKFLDDQIMTTTRGATEKSRLACATRELEQMHAFWGELTIVKAKVRSKGKGS